MFQRISRFVLALVLAVFTCPVLAQSQRDPVREEQIQKELEQFAPKALPDFKAATAALDQNNDQEAIARFRAVLKLAPYFDPALRRLGSLLAKTGQKEEGLKLARSAYEIRRSYENTISYAQTLAYPGADQSSSLPDKQHALMLAQQAAQEAKDSAALQLIAQLDLDLQRTEDFYRTSEKLSARYPNEMPTHYFAGLRAAMKGNWDKAESELNQAQALGLPAEAVTQILSSRDDTMKYVWQGAAVLLLLFLVWGVGLLALFVGGKVFSNLTLQSLENADPNVITSSRDSSLRNWYKRLINIAGLYYYISLPIVILLVIFTSAAAVAALWMIGFVFIKLVLILAIGALITIYQSIRSLFIKIEREDPGRALTAEEAPGLWALTREVAQAVGTRPIDEIRVTPGCEMAVYEKGGLRSKLHDEAKRILILGIATLNGMQQNALRAVLAHEYGHFSHRDTAGGEIALRVEQDMAKFAIAMALSGQAVWWNLAFQFLRVYHFIFSRLSQGATRLQEVLADRVAVRNYGAPAFETGLRHVIRREVEFHRAASQEIDAASAQRRNISNLYQLPSAQDQTDERMIQDEINNIITRPTSEDDSHPSPIDRFRLASRINSTPQLPDDAPVWELFANRNALTEEMSGQINQHVQEHIKEIVEEENTPKFTLLED